MTWQNFFLFYLFFVFYCFHIKKKLYLCSSIKTVKDMSDTLVITPTYNEKENIEAIIRKVFSLPKEFDMLIIEDNSPDGTADIVKRLMQEFPERLFIVERKGKLGLGTAYLDGMRWGNEHGYDYMIEMDADFSHNPDDLVRLYDACASGKGDVVVGSRYVGGKISVVNWPMGRLMMSYYASKYVRLVTGMKVADATAGFVCWSRRVLEKIKFDKVKFVGFPFAGQAGFVFPSCLISSYLGSWNHHAIFQQGCPQV